MSLILGSGTSAANAVFSVALVPLPRATERVRHRVAHDRCLVRTSLRALGLRGLAPVLCVRHGCGVPSRRQKTSAGCSAGEVKWYGVVVRRMDGYCRCGTYTEHSLVRCVGYPLLPRERADLSLL